VCYLVSAVERKGLKLRIGSDDQAKIYLNGRSVYEYTGHREAFVDDDTADGITLQKGINVLVFKVVNEQFSWAGCLRFADQQDKPFTDFQIRLTPGP
jgi:hypothetical protein